MLLSWREFTRAQHGEEAVGLRLVGEQLERLIGMWTSAASWINMCM